MFPIDQFVTAFSSTFVVGVVVAIIAQLTKGVKKI